MQHAPINDPGRYRLQELSMGNAPEVVPEVGIHNFPMPAIQQLFHFDLRLLGVSPRTVGVEFRWRSASKIGSSTSIAAVMVTRSRKVEMPSGLSLPLAFGMYTRLI
jgi:hypothetical protein